MNHPAPLPFLVARWCVQGIGNLIFPPMCPRCEATLDTASISPMLCHECAKLFSPQMGNCRRCAAFRVKQNERLGNCSECANRKFSFDQAFALAPYAAEVSDAVLKMKYSAGTPMAMAVGRMLSHFADCMDQNDQPELATCVPKHWLKRLVTGVNSAETLMDGLGMEANLPVAADLLICRRRIGKQSKLSLPARRRNMSGAWKVSKNYEIKKAHVVVVDDIMTTGATAHEVARVLKQAGARRVTVMAVARTIKTQ